MTLLQAPLKQWLSVRQTDHRYNGYLTDRQTDGQTDLKQSGMLTVMEDTCTSLSTRNKEVKKRYSTPTHHVSGNVTGKTTTISQPL